MKRRLWALTAALLCLVGLAACREEPSTERATPIGTSTWTIEAGGQSRSYILYVPANRPDPAPLVLMLHGGFGTAEHAQDHYGWDAAAQRHGFVVAYPQGLGRAWAAGGGCCGRPAQDGIDDVAFLSAVVADVGRRVGIDPDRHYATGMSNGGIMAYRLACETDAYAAIAPVAATLLGDCRSPAPISVLHIHGLDDTRVRYDGQLGEGVGQIDGPPVPSIMDTWRTADGCPPPGTVVEGSVTTARSECPDGRSVVLVSVAGAGHQWPGSTVSRGQEILGSDAPSTAFDATALIAEFFAAHVRA